MFLTIMVWNTLCLLVKVANYPYWADALQDSWFYNFFFSLKFILNEQFRDAYGYNSLTSDIVVFNVCGMLFLIVETLFIIYSSFLNYQDVVNYLLDSVNFKGIYTTMFTIEQVGTKERFTSGSIYSLDSFRSSGGSD